MRKKPQASGISISRSFPIFLLLAITKLGVRTGWKYTRLSYRAQWDIELIPRLADLSEEIANSIRDPKQSAIWWDWATSLRSHYIISTTPIL